MATKLGDLMAPNGTYRTQDGEEKTRWIKCGVAIHSDKGLRIKLEAVPVGEFDGWMSVFEDKPKDQAPKQEGFRSPPTSEDEPKF
jgi:hypothetical protein